MSAGFNLANLSADAREAVQADKAACRLIQFKRLGQSDWRAWANAEIAKLSPAMQALVKAALNKRLGFKGD